MNLTYGSLCSGIGSETVAWKPLGWQCKWMSEVSPFCCYLLRKKYPTVPNLGDMSRINLETLPAVNVVVGGTPCQSFSMAGLRRGMADERGNLALVFIKIVAAIRPRWVIWENVLGALSIDGGRAFASILGGLAECGYGWAYRVLDLRDFGIPQRRKRLFVVGHSGGSRPAVRAIFNRLPTCPDSSSTNSQRKTSLARIEVDGWNGDETPKRGGNYSLTIRSQQGGEGVGVILPPTSFSDFSGSLPPIRMEDSRTTILCRERGQGFGMIEGKHRLRKFTSIELERLQGFPDNYTKIRYYRAEASYSERLFVLGNAFPPPMLNWIGRGIELAEGEEAALN